MAGKRGPSIRRELLLKSREAALHAVQTFNNPLTTFKAETFIVLMTIAWMYLLHAYYRREGVDYRYYEQGERGPKLRRTRPGGPVKYWELESCLKADTCPIEGPAKQNLRFLIGLRNEIEHHKSTGCDQSFSGRYLACCLNYERYIVDLFGEQYSLGDAAAFTLHFRDLRIPKEPEESLLPLPSNVAKYVQEFDATLEERDYQSLQFSYRTIFVPKLVNHRGQADRAIEFIGADSELAKEVDRQYWVQKEIEKPKFLPSQVVSQMRELGYKHFGMHQHTQLWKGMEAKKPGKGYGVEVAGAWYWYERWVDEVKKHCSTNAEQYMDPLQ